MSTSDSSFEPPSVHLSITAEDGASELLLLNGAYNQVGQAIGSLDVDVAPGQYHVRQRIGGTESIVQFDVQQDAQAQKLSLKPLDFPSPAPIIGTSTFQKVVVDDWKKPPALVGKPGIRFAMRAPGQTSGEIPDEAALTHLKAEMARLRIETMQSDLVCNFQDGGGTANLDENGLFLRDVALQPGQYVLVQSMDGDQQRCLPLIVHAIWSPRVYLLCLRDLEAEGLDTYLPVHLENASIIYWPSESADSPAQPDLIRIEAARKALARGRSLGGYLDSSPNAVSLRDPMLALIDAYLVLKDMLPSETGQAAAAIDAAARALGEDFPDVIALRHAYASALAAKSPAPAPVPAPLAPGELSGPPMLANSWRHLLAARRANALLSKIMPADFVPEPSSTWFIWTEKPGSRSASRGRAGEPPRLADEMAEFGARALTALLGSPKLKGWIARAGEGLRREQGTTPGPGDALLAKLLEGIATIESPLLQQAFGREELVRRVLSSLNLPNARLKDLLDALVATRIPDGVLAGRVNNDLRAALDRRLDIFEGKRVEEVRPLALRKERERDA